MPLAPSVLVPLPSAETQSEAPYAEGNRLFIPQINVDAEIIEGEDIDVLRSKEGVWHDPTTGDPELGGNMVLAGHRFQYLPPNTHTFYHLDKLKISELIKVYWQGKEYVYEISKIFEVLPEEVWIKSETPNELTLYTCTPLFTSEKRLVVKAKLV